MTGSYELIGLEDRDAWESALGEVPHTFAHRWDHCHAIATSSDYATYLYCFRSPEARIVCPIAERPIGPYVDVVTPYGFSGFIGTGDCRSFSSHWSEFAERRGYVCGYLILNPLMPNETYFGDDAEPHRTLFVLDLRPHQQDLFRGLATTRRTDVRKAIAADEALVTDRERLTGFFITAYPRFMASRGASVAHGLGEESLKELCRSPHVIPVGAQTDEGLQAIALFGFTRYGADFLFNVSLPGGERHSVMLIWSGIRMLKARGVPTLNLGGGVREGDGLEQFKKRFGGERVPLHNIKQVYRPDVYEELCGQAGVDPESGSYFPAYRDPRLR